MSRAIEKARAKIAEADAILITAGAGMGVDSGLPDFRGNPTVWLDLEKLWKKVNQMV